MSYLISNSFISNLHSVSHLYVYAVDFHRNVHAAWIASKVL